MSYSLWEVGGTFVIPGCRDKVTLPFIVVGDFSKQEASKNLAPMLRDKFASKLVSRGGHSTGTIGDNFPMMHLTWRTFQKKALTHSSEAKPEGWESETT